MSEHSASPARRRSSISDAPSTADEAIAQLEQYAALVARLESENSVLTAQRDRARAEGESLREQAMAQVKGLQKSARAKDEALKKLRAELKSAAAVTAERVAAQDARSAHAEATRADLARALARVQELEDRQKLQARAYRKQRAELLRLRDIAEKDIETAESQANVLAEAEARAYTAEQNRLDEVARAHAELEELQASARADIERARAEAEDQQTEMDRVRKELASTKAALQHITEEHTRAQVAMEKERRGRHELVSKVQHDASAQHKKLARRVTKLSAELAACNESLSMEKQGAARANAEMLKLLASVEAAETKLKAEVAARAAEAKEHLKVVAQLESEHCEHAENLRRLSENREAALLSQHEYEQRQLGTLSPQKALSTSSSPPNLTNDRTQLVLVNAERQQGTDALSLDEVAPKSLKDPRQLHLESVLDAVQAEVSMLKTSNERKEKELETVRRQHEMQMRNVREKTEMRIGNLLQRLEERHKKSLAENVPVEGEERKGESTTSCASTKPTVANGSRVSAMTLETTTAAAKAGAPSSSSSSSTTTIMSKDYADELREKYRQTLHELSVSRAGAERLMAERASFSSQVASMDAQLKAMHDLVKQLERARDAASTQHENERKLLEKQVVRLVQGVRKCKAQLMKRRDQVARLKSNFIKFRDSMTRQGGARAAHIYNHSSLLLLANGGGLMYQTPPGTPSRKALPQRDGNGGRALPYSPSGLFYNPMTLQLSTPNNEHAGGNVGRRRYRSGTPLIASSIQGGKDISTNSPRPQSRREKRKRLRTRALLLPLLTTVQNLWEQLARCSFEVLMHSPKCAGMRPADVLALSSQRLLNIERCVQSLLLATSGFSKSNSPVSKFTSSFNASTQKVKETTRGISSGESTWSSGIASLLSLLPLSGKDATGMPSISVSRPMSPVRNAAGFNLGREHGKGTNATSDLDDVVVPLFEQLIGQIYLFASEVVVLRRRVNDYTEALLSKAWEKEAQFQREFNDEVEVDTTPAGMGLRSTGAGIISSSGTHSSGLVFGEDEEEDEEDDNDKEKKRRIAGANSVREGSTVEDTAVEEETFMDDDRANAILLKLQADGSLGKKSFSDSEWRADTL